MTEDIEDDVIEAAFELEAETHLNQKIEGLKQASRQRKYQIRREIEEAAELRRFNALFDDPDI